MLAKHYAKAIKRNIDQIGHVAFPPTKDIKLGYVGELINGVFEYRTSLQALGIEFEALEDEVKDTPLVLTSDNSVQVKNNATGEVPHANTIGLEAGLNIHFNQKNGVFILLEGVQTLYIKDQIALKREVERRFNSPASSKEIWEKDWVVITEVTKGQRGSVLISKEKESAYNLHTRISAVSNSLGSAAGGAEFGKTAGDFAACSMVNANNVTAYFKLHKIRQFLGDGKFKPKTKDIEKPVEVPPGKLEELPVPSYEIPGEGIRVLAIGINEYKDPKLNLDGCIKDVENLKTTLQDRFDIPEENYKILKNGEANRKGIINAFREHFADMEDGGVAVLHFSGHGGFERAGSEFTSSRLEMAGGRHETLVCYDTNDIGIYDIADKELRWLVHELQYPKDKQGKATKKEIHFVALLDCCHSASMFRKSAKGVKIKRRLKPRPKPRSDEDQLEEIRPIDDFIGPYSNQIKDNKLITLPKVHYISLSACGPKESAVETEEGGLFTQALVKVLQDTNANVYYPSYADLFNYCRTVIKGNEHNQQNPYIEFAGESSPHSAFLLQGETAEQTLPALNWDGERKQWLVALGAIHGVTLDAIDQMGIPVYRGDGQETLVCHVKAKIVQLEYTVVTLPADAPLTNDTKIAYTAGLVGFQLPIKVTYEEEGLDELNGQLSEALKKGKNRPCFAVQATSSFNELTVHIELRVARNQLVIYRHHPQANELVYGCKWSKEHQRSAAIEEIIDRLKRIARWEQVNQLVTPKSTTVKEDKVDFVIEYQDYEGTRRSFRTNTIEPVPTREVWSEQETHKLKPYEEKIICTKKKGGIPISWYVDNTSGERLYYYLIFLGDKYQVHLLNQNYTKGEEGITELKNDELLAGEFKMTQSLKFVLLSSNNQFNLPYLFSQVGFDEDYGEIKKTRSTKSNPLASLQKKKELVSNAAEWSVKRLDVQLLSNPEME